MKNQAGLAWMLGLAAFAGAGEAAAETATDPVQAIAAGKLILEERTRYETVDQQGLARSAEAFTTRTRLGWQTAQWAGFSALVEVQNVAQLGPEHYNVAIPGPGGASLNGKTLYPIVNDPRSTRLQLAQLAWKPVKPLTFTVGRQAILIDDQRFVGDVGWRQNAQTFDAVRADVAVGGFKATYAYLSHINRIFGGEKDWDSQSHLFNASYRFADLLTVEGFDYALDFTNSPINSSQTYGVKLVGKTKASGVTLGYDATFARQTPYGNEPQRFNLGYWQGDLSATAWIVTGKVDYEVLQGNGQRGFSTPLATTHPFQGWSDAFATAGGNKTEVDGIRDLNFTAVVRPPFAAPFLSKPELMARWHDFHADLTGAQLGSELDLMATAAVTSKLSALVKYADFHRENAVPAGTVAAPPSRSKVWVGFEFKL